MPPGRPREFDQDEVLDRALDVFWRKGYEGASLADLTAAMGINRPSLYAAFGDKEGLFRAALDRYVAGPSSFVSGALAEPNAREAVERLLCGAARALTDPAHPPGCLAVQGALVCSDAAASVKAELTRRRAASEAVVRARLERAVAEGELSEEVDVEALARYFMTVFSGHGGPGYRRGWARGADGGCRDGDAGLAELSHTGL